MINRLPTNVSRMFGVFLCLYPLLTSVGFTQDKLGGLAFVNMVNSTNNTAVSVNGKALSSKGLEFGQATSVLGFPQGPTSIEVANGDYKPASLQLNVSGAASPIVICYSLPDNKNNSRQLKIGKVSNSSDKGKVNYRIIYVGGQESIKLYAGDRFLGSLAPNKLESLAASGDELAAFSVNKGEPTDISRSEVGNYLVVVAPDASGNNNFRVTCVSDYVVTVP